MEDVREKEKSAVEDLLFGVYSREWPVEAVSVEERDAYVKWSGEAVKQVAVDPRSAYYEGGEEARADLSRLAHDARAVQGAGEEHRTGLGDYVKALVYGGLDGILSTFAMVCGIQGGGLTAETVIILGFAKLFSGAVGMAVGDFLSESAENRFRTAERKREEWEFDNYPEGERREMVCIYVERGMDRADAEELVAIISQDRDVFVDFMMVYELELLPEDQSPLKSAAVTFASFAVFGVVPLLIYAVVLALPIEMDRRIPFAISWIAVAITLFALGALKSKFSSQRWYLSGLIVVAYGAIGALSAFFLGWFIDFLLNLI